ncbi:MAG: rod shape-determining protein, partial [Syntrophomonadaceae bacterium]|nr:rod shape-determining protein [Syntrophomonadaceae bacterium]
IIQHLKKNYSLLIGERSAEDIKTSIGSALWEGPADSFEVRGRDLVSGLPKTIEVSALEIKEALAETVEAIIDGIKVCLERTPPELASDIMDRGIVLAGGGALLKGIDKLISNETNMPVYVCEEPLLAVARGTGKVLENIDVLKRVLISPKKSF